MEYTNPKDKETCDSMVKQLTGSEYLSICVEGGALGGKKGDKLIENIKELVFKDDKNAIIGGYPKFCSTIVNLL